MLVADGFEETLLNDVRGEMRIADALAREVEEQVEVGAELLLDKLGLGRTVRTGGSSGGGHGRLGR